MTQPTKADLTAAVAKLTEENAGLRDLLGAVCVMADAPKPAAYSDRYYWECTDRLSSIAVWAKLDYAGPDEAAVIRGWAKAVREKAAEPVGYEVYAEPEGDELHAEAAPAAANPPYHVTGAEQMCRAADNKSVGYICTAQDGHDGPDHIAYKPGGGEYHRWPAAAVAEQSAAYEAAASVTL